MIIEVFVDLMLRADDTNSLGEANNLGVVQDSISKSSSRSRFDRIGEK
jgi:hypothetical protein